MNAEEKRDILSATKGNLEFEVVTQALQTLWDEQFLGRSSTSYRPSSSNYFQESFNVLEEPDYNDWWPSDGYDSYWTEAGYSDQPWEDDWWGEDHDLHHQQLASAEAPIATDPDDPALQDSLQAEKEAEGLALQAQRTWVEAQRATAALRRDRGFGQSKNGAAGKGTSGCLSAVVIMDGVNAQIAIILPTSRERVLASRGDLCLRLPLLQSGIIMMLIF